MTSFISQLSPPVYFIDSAPQRHLQLDMYLQICKCMNKWVTCNIKPMWNFFILKLKKYEDFCLLKCITVWRCFRRTCYSYCGNPTMEAQISTATVTTTYQTRRCHNRISSMIASNKCAHTL